MKINLIALFLFTSQLPIQAQNLINDSIPIQGKWSTEKINKWYEEQPWLVGCNYYPSTAINRIEMWQASTWDPKTIDKELSWAADIGMNTLRVFLHDLVWKDDKEGLYSRMNEFLTICKKYEIRPWFVFFDDCHAPKAKLGDQPLPVKGYHNSGWVNCPSRELALRYAENKASNEEINHLKGYVQQTMFQFKEDDRILMWELYNEPGRGGVGGAGYMNDKSNKLVYNSWIWAREVNPSQPITSTSEGAAGEGNVKINRTNADLHSIHSYSGPADLRNLINDYKQDGRPIIMTEWLARSLGSTVEDCLPILKEFNVGAVNWGFVSGKSGTVWDWASRKDIDGTPLDLEKMRKEGRVISPGSKFPEPEIWFHDLFRIDGTPYNKKEVDVFRKLTGKR